MQQAEKPKFAQLVTDVLAFYRQDTSPFALQVWWSACERFDFEQVSKALTQHAMDPDRGQFAPKPADMVRMLQGTSTDKAMLAWGKCLSAMERVGAYTDVVFDDPAIHAVVEDLGGWPKVCRGDLKDLSYLQHRFTEAHRAYTGRGQFDYPRLLSGARDPDSVYQKHGLPIPKPAVVGDRERARQVYALGSVGGKTSVEFNAGALALSAVKALEVGRA